MRTNTNTNILTVLAIVAACCISAAFAQSSPPRRTVSSSCTDYIREYESRNAVCSKISAEGATIILASDISPTVMLCFEGHGTPPYRVCRTVAEWASMPTRMDRLQQSLIDIRRRSE